MNDVERLLRYALVPVEPPASMSDRVERRLTELTDAAVDELAEWDPSALGDPRRWARFVAAGVVAASAGGALVLVRARQKQRSPATRGFEALQKSIREVRGEAAARLRR